MSRGLPRLVQKLEERLLTPQDFGSDYWFLIQRQIGLIVNSLIDVEIEQILLDESRIEALAVEIRLKL